jgi:hypothetical protein
MLIVKFTILQSELGFPILTKGDFKGVHALSPKILERRISSISKHLQIRTVKDFGLTRIGSEGDGGYVMLNNFEGIEGVLSFGVGPDISWDLDISERTPLVHLYDHTVPELPTQIKNGVWFKEKVVSTEDSKGTTLEQAIARLPKRTNLILKSDIEDSEWEIIAQCSMDTLLKFDQIVIEFHWLTEKLFNHKFELMQTAFENLARTHSVINIHANNFADCEIIANSFVPSVIEISYVRNNSYTFVQRVEEADLNSPNFKDKPEIQLNFPIRG